MLADMRRDGDLPYYWIADNTRWMRKPRTFGGPEEALRRTVETYRKALWRDADAYVEIWLEKDALAGVVYGVTDEFDVPLMVSRGYASLSFLHSAAEVMAGQDRPCFIYHFGDYDPSGVNAAEKIEETLRDLAPEVNSTSCGRRLRRTRSKLGPAESPDQLTPSSRMSCGRWFAAASNGMPRAEFDRLRVTEEAERESLEEFLKNWPEAAAE